MPSSLIRGKHLLARVEDRSSAVVVSDGALFQRDGIIVEVGPYKVLREKFDPDEELGSTNHIVLPGLVNAHHHIGITPFQFGIPDLPLELWLTARMAARDVDPYLDTLYSAFQMIESGVTTVQHLDSQRRGPISAWPERTRKVLEAYDDIGMRTSYAFGIRDQNQIAYGSDDDLVKSLPEGLSAEVRTWLDGMKIEFDEYMETLFEGLYEKSEGNRADRLRVWMAPTNLHWCSDDLLLQCKDAAQRYRAGIHIHLLETAFQKEYAKRRFGKSAVRHLADIGFLGPEVTLGHAVWVTDEDIDILQATATCLCHNPSSNLRLRSGIAPINRLAEKQVRIAIGIDEAGINDDRDMLQELRLVKNLHREPGHEPTVPTASQVFQMATEHGAYTTGFAERVGILEPGRAADVVLMNLQNIAVPYLEADVPLVDAVIHRGRAADVDTVIIAGEVVFRDREFTKVDRRQVLLDLSRSLAKPLEPDEEARKVLSRRLFPYVRQFYENWPVPRGESFSTSNQRI